MAKPQGWTPQQLRQKTAPMLLCERAHATPGAIAFRSKHLGIYRERAWSDYATLVARTAKAFDALGLKPGERVAIMGDACEEWMICDLAAQSLGAIVYGIYPTASASETEYQMHDGGAVLFVAEDQEYVDRILPLADKLPKLRNIVVIDDSALFAYRHEKLSSYASLAEKGADADLAWLEAKAAKVEPDAPAFIVYTSGTTGNPKGALITHGKHLAGTYNIVTHYPLLASRPLRTVIYLPLCHVLGRDVAVTLPLVSGLVPHFGEDVNDVGQTMFEVAPQVLFTVPRYLQKFASTILVNIGSSSATKRAAYRMAMRLAREHVKRLYERRNSTYQSTLYRTAWATVFRPILNKLGFDKLELALSGGAPLPADTMALWHMFGVNVCEMYGQTETAGAIISGQRGPFPRPGNVGTVPNGWEVKLGSGDEILVHGKDLFDGYWQNEEATKSVLQADGWMKTGDVGEWRGGQLRLIDRARDFIVTSGGKTISPAYIENILRASPFIAEAVVFGHGRKYLVALIEMDFDTAADWARTNDIAYTGFTNLAANPALEKQIRIEIAKANEQVARVEQIKTFRILPKELDPEEEGEPVTPTRKVKRNLMYERFKPLVDAMYDGAEERLLAEASGGILN
ncbi:MAG: AMP-binding protein [Xanthobacteraceae bacterium]|nr:AMP-binding protein [Xanthobacteraceae bacterium]